MTSVINSFIKAHVSTKAGTLPTANTDLITDITPVNSDATLRCDFCPSIAGVLSVTYTTTAETTAKLFGGASLTAGVLYPFEVLVGPGEKINFQFSTTTGTYRLVVREV